MIPWHHCYTDHIEGRSKDSQALTDQELFCYWCISVGKATHSKSSIYDIVLAAAKDTYQAPIVEDKLEIDYCIQQLKEKGYIIDTLVSNSLH